MEMVGFLMVLMTRHTVALIAVKAHSVVKSIKVVVTLTKQLANTIFTIIINTMTKIILRTQ